MQCGLQGEVASLISGPFLLLVGRGCSGCRRWRKQSYLKQRRQKSVWKECMVCSGPAEIASPVSMLGVHSFNTASLFSVNSIYFSHNLFASPMSGKKAEMAWNTVSEGITGVGLDLGVTIAGSFTSSCFE